MSHDPDVHSAKRGASYARRSVYRQVHDHVGLGGFYLFFYMGVRTLCREAHGMGLVRESRLSRRRMVGLSVRG